MKKDLNQVARMEQAIEKRWGKEAIENPASHWDEEKEKEYLEQLKEQTKKASNLSAMEYVKNGRQGDYLACDQSGKPTNKPKMVGRDNTPGHDILKRVYSEDGKSPTITAHAGKGTVPKVETKPKKAYDIPRS